MLEGDERVGLGLVLDLQTVGIVLEKKRDDAKVGLRPRAPEFARLKLLRGDGRIVVHAQLVDDWRRTALVD